MSTIIGSSRNDTLSAGAGDDSISGGGGNDEIYTRGGADTVAGGPGTDVLIIGPGDSRYALAGINHPEHIAHFIDWSSSDMIVFAGGPDGADGLYSEITATSFDDAAAQAQAAVPMPGPAGYVAAQVGSDVVVFSGFDAVVLDNRTLNDFAPTNIHQQIPLFPSQPGGLSTGATITVSGSAIDNLNFLGAEDLPVSVENSGTLLLQSTAQAGGVTYHPQQFELLGNGFSYDASGELFGGTIFSITLNANPAPGASGGFHFTASGLDIPVVTLNGWAQAGDTASVTEAIFGGDDLWTGSAGPDLMRGLDGNDTLNALGGYDSVFGGTGDDVVFGSDASVGPDANEQSYLRGDEGNDAVTGGAGFDDINGNMGDDTLHGGSGDDWVVGGKDSDQQFGDAGVDIVWGNLGNDTLSGGDGADQVRGGQGDDFVDGGAGDDFVSGDRGNDTVVGGSGADLFHGSQDAGIDRVLDFRLSDGDRVMLDPGTTYSVSQIGADTVIDMSGGHQMILVGVQMSALTPGWIFEG